MGLGKKLQDHFFNNTFDAVMETLEAGGRLAEGKSDNTKALAAIASAHVGLFIAGTKLISPYSLAQSLMRSDEKIDERTKKIWEL